MKNYKFIIASAMLALGTSAVAQATYVDKDGNEYQFKKHFYPDIPQISGYSSGKRYSRSCYFAFRRFEDGSD